MWKSIKISDYQQGVIFIPSGITGKSGDILGCNNGVGCFSWHVVGTGK